VIKKDVNVRNVSVNNTDRILQDMISLPVSKRTKLYTCGQWSYVYPSFKEKKKNASKKDIRRYWQFGVQYEPWET
jgi:hypothetical protein